jgi:hypothetical protein
MLTRAELVVAIMARYVSGKQRERSRILDEFVAITRYHRKHAIRLLWAGVVWRRRARRVDRRYGRDV